MLWHAGEYNLTIHMMKNALSKDSKYQILLQDVTSFILGAYLVL